MGLLDKLKGVFAGGKKIDYRNAARESNRALDKLKANLDELRSERDRYWQEAKKQLQSGNKEDAVMALQDYKGAAVNVHKCHSLILITQSRISNIQNAATISNVTSSLGNIAKLVNVKIGDVESKFEALDSQIGDLASLDGDIAALAERDLKAIDRQLADSMGNDDLLMQKLQGEIDAENRRTQTATPQVQQTVQTETSLN